MDQQEVSSKSFFNPKRRSYSAKPTTDAVRKGNGQERTSRNVMPGDIEDDEVKSSSRRIRGCWMDNGV